MTSSLPSSRFPRPAFLAAALSLLLALAGGLLAGPASADCVDDAARAVAERTMDAMGGADAWAATRHVRFDFFGFRTHHWDRHLGRHRLEGKTREGQNYVVLLDLNSPADARSGQAWLDGEALEGEALAEWLNNAWGAWINDTYWLVMPFKLLDPGVHLHHDGEEEIDGRMHDRLKLTFQDVGLTPGDTYWAWFDRETGLMRRWAYHLEGWDAEREPTAWDWLDWQAVGDLKLSSLRRNLGDGSERSLGNLAVFDTLPDSVYTSGAPVE